MRIRSHTAFLLAALFGSTVATALPGNAAPEHPGTVASPAPASGNLLGQIPNSDDPSLKPGPDASLEQLYPQPRQTSPYSASSSDPSLTEKQRSEAASIQLSPIPASELLPIGGGKLPPIKLEASFNEALSLERALRITLENNLPIRISKAGFDSQRYIFLGSLGGFVPDLTLTYRGQRLENRSGATSDVFTKSATVRYPVFQGGGTFYSVLTNFYRTKAAKSAYYASVNDALLDAYKRYYDLVLNQTLLQIRVKSVELSRTQLRLNQQLKDTGIGTNFAIYQSRTQLALDKQALLQQQVQVRQASLQLAFVLNQSMAINIIPQEAFARELRLIEPSVDINDLINAAIKFRPELKQYENLRLAAARNVQLSHAPLYPDFQFFTSVTETRTLAGTGGGGLGGSTVVIPTGGSGGGGIGISGGGNRSVSAGFDLSWTLTGMGVSTVGNTLSAQALARQALLQSNLQYLTVLQQVRSSYLSMLTAREQVQVAAEALVSAAEELRLANLRVTYGQGINLELIQAQRNYVTALTNQAQAIIAYNVAQAQLLRDTGQISVSRLTSEYPRPIGLKPGKAQL